MEQGSNEWLIWRRQGIGASDAPIIMRQSPYSTPFELWQEKVGLTAGFAGNYATERGQRLEPKARAAYEILYDMDMPPMLVEHKDRPHFRASLDGANEERKILLEIKCIGAATFLDAKENKVIPRHHWIQIQHQLMVTGYKEAHYFAYYQPRGSTKGEGALVKIQPDETYFLSLMVVLDHFWNYHVAKKISPDLMDLDRKHQASALRKENRLRSNPTSI